MVTLPQPYFHAFPRCRARSGSCRFELNKLEYAGRELWQLIFFYLEVSTTHHLVIKHHEYEEAHPPNKSGSTRLLCSSSSTSILRKRLLLFSHIILWFNTVKVSSITQRLRGSDTSSVLACFGSAWSKNTRPAHYAHTIAHARERVNEKGAVAKHKQRWSGKEV